MSECERGISSIVPGHKQVVCVCVWACGISRACVSLCLFVSPQGISRACVPVCVCLCHFRASSERVCLRVSVCVSPGHLTGMCVYLCFSIHTYTEQIFSTEWAKYNWPVIALFITFTSVYAWYSLSLSLSLFLSDRWLRWAGRQRDG